MPKGCGDEVHGSAVMQEQKSGASPLLNLSQHANAAISPMQQLPGSEGGSASALDGEFSVAMVPHGANSSHYAVSVAANDRGSSMSSVFGGGHGDYGAELGGPSL